MSAQPPRQPGPDAPTPFTQGRGLRRSSAPSSRAHPSPKSDNTTTPARPRRLHTPRLRLTQSPPPTVKNAPPPTPLQGSSDPRWVLAIRTAELLQGDILTPESRDRIIRMGKMFNLTPFDANMIIAIVQDQARRGIAPALCPTAGEPQLRMITPPQRRSFRQILRSRHTLTVAALLTALLALEWLLVKWLF